MKTISEYLDYEKNVLQKNEHYSKYFEEWSVYWFEELVKPVIDVFNLHDEYEAEQTGNAFILFNEQMKKYNKDNNFPDLDLEKRNIYESERMHELLNHKFMKSELYEKMIISEFVLKKKFPLMVVFDEYRIEEKFCKKMKSDLKKQNPHINFLTLEKICKKLYSSPNFSLKIKEKYKELPWGEDYIVNNNKNVIIKKNLNLNPYTTLDTIRKNPEYIWNINKLIKNDFTKWRVEWIIMKLNNKKLNFFVRMK